MNIGKLGNYEKVNSQSNRVIKIKVNLADRPWVCGGPPEYHWMCFRREIVDFKHQPNLDIVNMLLLYQSKIKVMSILFSLLYPIYTDIS